MTPRRPRFAISIPQFVADGTATLLRRVRRALDSHTGPGNPGSQFHVGQPSGAPTRSRTSCTAHWFPSGSAKNMNLPPSRGSSG